MSNQFPREDLHAQLDEAIDSALNKAHASLEVQREKENISKINFLSLWKPDAGLLIGLLWLMLCILKTRTNNDLQTL